MPTIEDHEPKDSWIIARAFLLAEHEDALENVLCSMGVLDLEYRSRSMLGIQGLTQPDLVVLEIVHPNLGFGSVQSDQALVEDEGSFQEIEETLASLGSHFSSARLTVADIAIRDGQTFQTLKEKMSERPDVFEAGLDLLKP